MDLSPTKGLDGLAQIFVEFLQEIPPEKYTIHPIPDTHPLCLCLVYWWNNRFMG